MVGQGYRLGDWAGSGRARVKRAGVLQGGLQVLSVVASNGDSLL